MRRNIYDILNDEKIDLRVEYERLYVLFYVWKHEINQWETLSLNECVEQHFNLFSKTFRRRCISLDDFNMYYGYVFTEEPEEIDIEYIVRFAEYTTNLCIQVMCCRDFAIQRLAAKYLEHCKDCMEFLGFERVNKENIYLFVEKNPVVSAVAEITNKDLAYSVMEYNHHRLKGDLATKKSILKMMYEDIEPCQRVLNDVNKSLKSDLFQLMNKFVRHNNNDNKFIQSLNDKQLESICDDIYQMWLLAKMEIDQVERNKRMKIILEAVNAK